MWVSVNNKITISTEESEVMMFLIYFIYSFCLQYPLDLLSLWKSKKINKFY